MNRDAQIALVARYFQAVDAEDLPTILDTLGDGCIFTVETHGVRLEDRDAISGMFKHLWANHRAVCHHRFVYVADPEHGRISVRFQVENTETDGSLTRKSNCNFFEIKDSKFSAVAVYMAGPNTLDANG